LKECTPQAQPKTRSPPCGILCDACPLGSGAVADSAASTDKQITDCQIPIWSPFMPGGEAIDFLLEKIYKYFRS